MPEHDGARGDARKRGIITTHPGHKIAVTDLNIRWWTDCECGYTQQRASRTEALIDAFRHHHQAGGCNCPPEARDRPAHRQAIDPRHTRGSSDFEEAP